MAYNFPRSAGDNAGKRDSISPSTSTLPVVFLLLLSVAFAMETPAGVQSKTGQSEAPSQQQTMSPAAETTPLQTPAQDLRDKDSRIPAKDLKAKDSKDKDKDATVPADIEQLVATQFGPEFVADPSFSPLVMTADLDGDGIEDVVIVATSKNPLTDQQTFGFKVIDPYDEYFGTGDPRITVGFGTLDPKHNRYLLVIHGSGAKAWRAIKPKAKFVIINLPFDHLEITRRALKKKTISAIAAHEAIMNSVVYWSGKKYKWEADEIQE